MEQHELIHKILQTVKEIEIHTSTFVAQDSLSVIDIDVALDKTRRLYELILDLKQVPNSVFIEVKESVQAQQAVIKEVIQAIEPEPIVHILNFDEPKVIETPAVTIHEEPLQFIQEQKTEEIPSPIIITEPVAEQPIIEIQQPKQEEFVFEIQPEPIIVETPTATIPEPIIEKPTVVETPPVIEIQAQVEQKIEVQPQAEDKPKQESVAAKQFISQLRSERDLGSKLSKKPILNISSAIGLNERFQYIKGLFQNNSNDYNTTIKYLNGCSDLRTAMEFINIQFDWDYEDPLVQSFISIVERRFL